MHHRRVETLSALLVNNQIDAIALNAGATLGYLSGLHFHLSERPVVFLIIPGEVPVLILPELEMRKLEHTALHLEAYPYPENPSSWSSVFNRALSELKLSGCTLGIEPRHLRFLEYEFLSSAVDNVRIADISHLVATIRSVKDRDELRYIRQAVTIAQNALTNTLSTARIGMSESELANELVIQLLRAGSEPSLPFSPIVSSGPNGANPHAKPSERKLASGDLLIIDWGASYHGYVSDLTRTFSIGSIDSEMRRIHELVHRANRAGRQAGRPGVSCRSVDDAARGVIEAARLGEYFTHRTGHGIGLECHEDPYIRSDNEQLLQEGMTYTVEPGIYVSGKYGVRIEDDVVITSNGCESLSDFPRALNRIC